MSIFAEKKNIMQSFIELVKLRQSTRKYSSKEIPVEMLEQCIEAARLAPSASNSQPWKFVVVNEKQLREKVAAATWDPVIRFNKFVSKAPALVVITLEEPKIITKVGKMVKKKDWPHMDIGIAAEHFCLQASELGMGTCMIGWFNEKAIKKLLEVPAKRSIALVISIGFPPEDYSLREKQRKSASEITSWNKY